MLLPVQMYDVSSGKSYPAGGYLSINGQDTFTVSTPDDHTYRAMLYAERGYVSACRLSVRLSLRPWRLGTVLT